MFRWSCTHARLIALGVELTDLWLCMATEVSTAEVQLVFTALQILCLSLRNVINRRYISVLLSEIIEFVSEWRLM
jgi:hypothetical protein